MADNSESDSNDEDYVPGKNDDEQSASGSDDEDTDLNSNEKESKNNPADSQSQRSVEELWSEFVQGTDSPPVVSNSIKNSAQDLNDKPKPDSTTSDIVSSSTSTKKTVTEIFEFAGEEVKVTKEVDLNSEDVSPSEETELPVIKESKSASKRPGGLSGILSQIGKKQKIGTLQKSKLDWDGYKKAENIEEELAQHNRGRGGFLERQDFLQRSDLRQFEIEKELRMSRRKN